ncbi:MAG: hypothetical protein AMJ46_14350 [Latescibacteria bacterium DG_63]|nr:MAG: hypothetical protein AMJ46_14350 [Latescibacteria bacterium DG_63]
MNGRRMATATSLAALLVASGLWARTLHVPGEYSTIQEGLENAVPGDTVLVASGTYPENIVWPASAQGVVLTSESGAASTVIDGRGLGTVVTFEGTFDSTTVISGFTVTNGSGGPGSGIYCWAASPKIEGNWITGNSTDWNGGGVSGLGSNSIIRYNVITGNSAYYEGGGIHFDGYGEGGIGSDGSLDLVSAFGVPDDGARQPHALIERNRIEHNVAARGGGIGIFKCFPKVTKNRIAHNSATWGGGGIYGFRSPDLEITWNEISNNSAEGDSGGGLLFYDWTSADLHHDNIHGNEEYGVKVLYGPGPTEAFWCWWGHPSGPYHPVTNPLGQGDWVSDGVYYYPWLFEPNPIVLVAARPAEPTVTQGGELEIGVRIDNLTDYAQPFWALTEVVLPDSTLISPVVGPVHLSVDPAQCIARRITHHVPLAAPVGTYVYRALIGRPPDDIWDRWEFQFEVISSKSSRGTEIGQRQTM